MNGTVMNYSPADKPIKDDNPEQAAAARLAAAPTDFQALHEIVAKARANLNQNDWDYIVGGTETETTLCRNRSVYRRGQEQGARTLSELQRRAGDSRRPRVYGIW
jgi:hypothetical protein